MQNSLSKHFSFLLMISLLSASTALCVEKASGVKASPSTQSIAAAETAAIGKVEAALKLSPAGGFVASTEKVLSDIKKLVGKAEPFALTYIKIKADDLKTGIELRDDHLHKHMKTDANPWIDAKNFKLNGGTGTADVTLNGVTQNVPLTYKATPTNVTFSFAVVPTQFKIEEAKYLGIRVKDEVQVQGNLSY